MSVSNHLFRGLVALRLASSFQQRISSVSASSYSKEPSAWEQTTYKYFLPIQTRWSDNDQYGHVNNIVYYSYFDSVINHYLIKTCGLDTNLKNSNIVGFMVDTGCSFRRPLTFPEKILAGLKVAKVGRSSVTYQIAIFGEKTVTDGKNPARDHAQMEEVNFKATSLGDFNPEASAVGHCVHIFVHPDTNAPIALPKTMKTTLYEIM